MKVPRSENMQLVGYFLARCGSRPEDGGPTGPPAWLGTPTWRDTYALFHDVLGDGRTLSSFANSLKNTRDAFDAHLPSGRIGWLLPDHQSPKEEVMVGRILAKWAGKTDQDLREAIEQILTGAATDQSDEAEEATVRTEGGLKVRTVRKYERSRQSREDAIAFHGVACLGCGFDFSKEYGDLGKGYIEVHHAMPLAEYGVRETVPEKDLLVLCANCHRMVHRRQGICLSLDELKGRIATVQKTRGGVS